MISAVRRTIPHPHLRVGLAGAFAAVLVCALLWATMAIGALPADGALGETLGPNRGALAIMQVMFWCGVITGAILSILSIVYGFIQRLARQD